MYKNWINNFLKLNNFFLLYTYIAAVNILILIALIVNNSKKLNKECLNFLMDLQLLKYPIKRKHFIEYFFFNKVKRWHKFHIVSPSPWPFSVSMMLLMVILHFVSLLYRDYSALAGFYFGLILLFNAIILWFRDIIRESTFMGYHSIEVQMMHRTGFVLFSVSEVMIFFGFFWAYFHFCFTPSIFGGNIWPPEGIVFFFLSENICDDLRYIYLIGYYFTDATLTNFYLRGLLFFSDNLCKYMYLYFLFDDKTFFNLVYYFKFDFSKILKINNLDLPVVLDLNFKTLKIQNMFFYNYYNLNPFIDLGLNTNSSYFMFLNLFDSGALINPYRIPLLNTVVLLTSGCILMWSHSCLRLRSYLRSLIGLAITILFAFYFIGCQIFEYIHAAFSINDGVFGSIFYMLTGLHGFHVIVGTLFSIVCLYRLVCSHFTSTNHFGFEAAIWYWHFVDVIWIFLYIFVYIWPNIYYFGESYVLNFFDKNNFYFNISFKDIKHYSPIFDYNQPVWNTFELKIWFIHASIWKFLCYMYFNYIK